MSLYLKWESWLIKPCFNRLTNVTQSLKTLFPDKFEDVNNGQPLIKSWHLLTIAFLIAVI
jgi:hypothetical protein